MCRWASRFGSGCLDAAGCPAVQSGPYPCLSVSYTTLSSKRLSSERFDWEAFDGSCKEDLAGVSATSLQARLLAEFPCDSLDFTPSFFGAFQETTCSPALPSGPVAAEVFKAAFDGKLEVASLLAKTFLAHSHCAEAASAKVTG
jgi:hypothetical protein